MGNQTSTPGSFEGSNDPAVQNDLLIKFNEVSSVNNDQTPTSREGHLSFVVGSTVYFFGGGLSTSTGPVQSNDLYSFDLETKKWNQIKTQGATPSSRTGAASVLLNGKLYVFGGFNTEEGWLNDLHVLDVSTLTWSSPNVTGTVPQPRDKAACAAFGKKIIFFGGFAPVAQAINESDEDDMDEEEEEEEPRQSATFGWFNDVHILDTESNTWSKHDISGTAPSPRAAFGIGVVGSKLYIFGGRDTSQRVNDVHILDVEKMAWESPTISGTKPAPRSFHSCTTLGTKIILFGGLSRENTHLNDVHIFDTETLSWLQPKVEGSVKPRGFHTASLVNDKILIFGGSADFDISLHECKTFFNDLFTLSVDKVVQQTS